MFSSIRRAMAVILSIVVMSSSTWVLWLAVAEHEELFLESQKNNLFALTRNMANDLVPYMEQTERDSFALSIVLLRLEPYNNVINATIYDNEYNQVEHYVGRGARRTEQGLQEPPIDPSVYELGINIEQGKLISLSNISRKSEEFITHTSGHSIILILAWGTVIRGPTKKSTTEAPQPLACLGELPTAM